MAESTSCTSCIEMYLEKKKLHRRLDRIKGDSAYLACIMHVHENSGKRKISPGQVWFFLAVKWIKQKHIQPKPKHQQQTFRPELTPLTSSILMSTDDRRSFRTLGLGGWHYRGLRWRGQLQRSLLQRSHSAGACAARAYRAAPRRPHRPGGGPHSSPDCTTWVAVCLSVCRVPRLCLVSRSLDVRWRVVNRTLKLPPPPPPSLSLSLSLSLSHLFDNQCSPLWIILSFET